MEQRVPDEYFRPAAESDDVRRDAAVPSLPGTAAVKAVAPGEVRDGLAPRAVATIAIVAVGLGFALGRFWLFAPGALPQSPGLAPASPSASATATPSPDALAPYDGPVAAVRAVAAEGRCVEGGIDADAQALIDGDDETIWRCRGRGVDEAATFTFPGPRPLVGLRLVNGNTVWTDRYLAERRIVGIRWTFADGSYFDQGLVANDRNPQEVRFPEVTTDQVTFQILEATVPGSGAASADAVSNSSLEFLGPAR